MPVYSGLDVAGQPDYGSEFPGVYPYTRWVEWRAAAIPCLHLGTASHPATRPLACPCLPLPRLQGALCQHVHGAALDHPPVCRLLHGRGVERFLPGEVAPAGASWRVGRVLLAGTDPPALPARSSRHPAAGPSGWPL